MYTIGLIQLSFEGFPFFFYYFCYCFSVARGGLTYYVLKGLDVFINKKNELLLFFNSQ